MECAASENRETCFGRLFIKLFRVEFWRFLFFVVVRSFTADSNLLQPTGRCEQNTFLTSHFLVSQHTFQCRRWHWLKVVRITSSMLHAQCLCFREWRVMHFDRQQSSHRLWAKIFDDYHISESTDVKSSRSPLATTGPQIYILEFDDFSIGNDSQIPNSRENPCRGSGFHWNDRKEQILVDYRAEIQKHEFQADSDRRSIQELNGIVESQRREIDHTIARDEQLWRDPLLLHEKLPEQNRDIREAHIRSLHEIEELKRVEELRIDEFSRRRLIENQDTISELFSRSWRDAQPSWECRAATMGRQTIGTRMVRNTYHRMYRMNAKQHSLGSEMPVWTVESVDDLKSLRSIRGIHGPD